MQNRGLIRKIRDHEDTTGSIVVVRCSCRFCRNMESATCVFAYIYMNPILVKGYSVSITTALSTRGVPHTAQNFCRKNFSLNSTKRRSKNWAFQTRTLWQVSDLLAVTNEDPNHNMFNSPGVGRGPSFQFGLPACSWEYDMIQSHCQLNGFKVKVTSWEKLRIVHFSKHNAGPLCGCRWRFSGSLRHSSLFLGSHEWIQAAKTWPMMRLFFFQPLSFSKAMQSQQFWTAKPPSRQVNLSRGEGNDCRVFQSQWDLTEKRRQQQRPFLRSRVEQKWRKNSSIEISWITILVICWVLRVSTQRFGGDNSCVCLWLIPKSRWVSERFLFFFCFIYAAIHQIIGK